MKIGCLLQRTQGNFNFYQLGSVTSVSHGNCHEEHIMLKMFRKSYCKQQTVAKPDDLEKC